MRISDWSSDVCSSDLGATRARWRRPTGSQPALCASSEGPHRPSGSGRSTPPSDRRAAPARCRAASRAGRPTSLVGRRPGSARPTCGFVRWPVTSRSATPSSGTSPRRSGPGRSRPRTLDIRRMKVRIEQERITANEDPEFHLKLGPGSLSDIEWTVQLLQLRHGLAGTNPLGAPDALVAAGHMPEDDAAVLVDSYRFCEHTRNRSFLVTGPGDALPTRPEDRKSTRLNSSH